MFFKSFKTF